MRPFSYSFCLFLCFFSLSSCHKDNNDTVNNTLNEKNSILLIKAEDLKTDKYGLSLSNCILKTVHGNIYFKFYPKIAPNTVVRVIELIRSGFYDGLKFHRVIPNYIAQTGDPTGSGRGGSGIKLKAEFSKIQHIKGTVAMARNQEDKDSSDSQFYFTLTTLPHLDGNYTIIGQVTKGLDILEKLTLGDKILSLSFDR